MCATPPLHASPTPPLPRAVSDSHRPPPPTTTTQELVTAALTQADVKKETDKFWLKIKERAAKVASAAAEAAAEQVEAAAEAVAEGSEVASAAAEAAAEQVEAAAEAVAEGSEGGCAPNGPRSPVCSSGELETEALSTTTHAAGDPGRSSQVNGAALAAQHVQAKDVD